MNKLLIVLFSGYLCLVSWAAWSVNANPTVGSVWVWLGPTFGADWQTFNGIIQADTFAAQRALVGGVQNRIIRRGYYSPGDGGGASYDWSSSPCSLNAGAGDNGSQVQPLGGGGCWLADLTTMRANPIIWGAVGDAVTDDTAAVQAAINALPRGTLYIPNKIFAISSITVSTQINIIGTNGGTGQNPWNVTAPCTSGFRENTANQITFTLQVSSDIIDGICIDNANVTNTSGAGIYIPGSASTPSSTIVKNSQINGACIGVDVTAVGSNQVVAPLIENNFFHPAASNSCAGIRIGHQAVSAAGQPFTTEVRLNYNEILCSGASAADGIRVEEAGGLFIVGGDDVACNNGIRIFPGSSQLVAGALIENTSFDSSQTNGISIDTASGSFGVTDVRFTGVWSSSSVASNNVLIQNNGGNTTRQIHFTALQALNTAGSAQSDVAINSNTIDITFDSSTICGNGNNVSYMFVINTQGRVAVRGSQVGACTGAIGSVLGGITFQPAATFGNIDITGNILSGTNPFVYSPGAGGSTVAIESNLGLNNVVGLVASAATITAPVNPTFTISGTASIQTINGGWAGRKVTILPSGAFQFVTGGNILIGLTASVNVPINGVFDGTNWFFK